MAVPTPRSRWPFDTIQGATSQFVSIEGEGIGVESHGEHDFVYHQATPVTDDGTSSVVFEEGTGMNTGGVGSLVPDVEGFNDGRVVENTEGTLQAVTSPKMEGDGAIEFQSAPDGGTEFNYVDVAERSYDTQFGFTFAAWGYLRSDTDIRNLMEVTPGEGFYLETDGGSGGVMRLDTSIKDDQGDDYGPFATASFSLNTYVHWIGTYEPPTTWRLYKNGIRAGETTDGLNLYEEAGSLNFYIGADSDPPDVTRQNWDGFIDDPAVWEEYLTDSEASEWYNQYF